MGPNAIAEQETCMPDPSPLLRDKARSSRFLDHAGSQIASSSQTMLE